MTDADALLAAIRAHPDEDAPRLMFADEIETSEPARAEFIRVQVELARVDAEPVWCPHVQNGALVCHDPRCPYVAWRDRRERLRHRGRELWDAQPVRDGAPGDFFPGFPGWALETKTPAGVSPADTPLAVVRRGFIDEVHLSAAEFVGGGPCDQCDAGRVWHERDSECSWECPDCHGTGTRPEWAAQIFEHPVRVVRLSDKRPEQATPDRRPYFFVANASGLAEAHPDHEGMVIPLSLAQRGDQEPAEFIRERETIYSFATPAAANDWLSETCVAFGRRAHAKLTLAHAPGDRWGRA